VLLQNESERFRDDHFVIDDKNDWSMFHFIQYLTISAYTMPR